MRINESDIRNDTSKSFGTSPHSLIVSSSTTSKLSMIALAPCYSYMARKRVKNLSL